MISIVEIEKLEAERKILTPYQRIIKAARDGKGVRLTKWDVAQMATDTAIFALADNDENL